jgi:hypothetical protein
MANVESPDANIVDTLAGRKVENMSNYLMIESAGYHVESSGVAMRAYLLKQFGTDNMARIDQAMLDVLVTNSTIGIDLAPHGVCGFARLHCLPEI